MNIFATIAPPGFSIVAAKLSADSISSRERASSRARYPGQLGRQVACDQIGAAAKLVLARAPRRSVENIADDRDCARRTFLTGARSTPTTRPPRPTPPRGFQAIRRARIRNPRFARRCRRRSRLRAMISSILNAARDGNPSLARLAIKFVVRFVSRHEKFSPSKRVRFYRARRSRYLMAFRAAVPKL